MGKIDHKTQTRKPTPKASNPPNRKPADAPQKRPTGRTRRPRSSKHPPLDKDPVPRASFHAKDSPDSTSETGRSIPNKVHLAKKRALRRGNEYKVVKENIKTPTEKSPPVPQSTSATQFREPRFTTYGDSPDNNPEPEPAQLTRKNLALFNKMAGITGPEEAESPKWWADKKTNPSQPSSKFMAAFARKSMANGILDADHSSPPANLEVLQERCARSRGSPSPTLSAFQRYRKGVREAMNESTLQFVILAKLMDDHETHGFVMALDQRCVAFPKNVGFNNGLPALQPDFVEGLMVQEFGLFPVEEYVEGALLHDKDYAIVLAHFAGEFKANDGNLKHARIQIAHTGASLVYARNQALKHLVEEEPSGNAEVITFVTDGSILRLYAHYASRDEDGNDKYFQSLIDQTFLDTFEGYKDGRKWLRNAREYAKEQSCLLKDRLKKQWEKTAEKRTRLKEEWEKRNDECGPAQRLRTSRPPTPSTKPPRLPGDSKVTSRGRGQKAPLPKRSGRITKLNGVKPPVRRSVRLAKIIN